MKSMQSNPGPAQRKEPDPAEVPYPCIVTETEQEYYWSFDEMPFACGPRSHPAARENPLRGFGFYVAVAFP